jgi:hypothetical protein
LRIGAKIALSPDGRRVGQRSTVSVLAPAGEHLYWVLGGTRGLHRSVDSHTEQSTSTGIRVVAAVVVVLLIDAALVVLARVGLWQQAFVSERLIRFRAWTLAAVFLLEAVASFTWSREYEWWMSH